MALAGEGALAIWHDIAPEGRAAFYAWHGREHMAERVAIPGFLRGRRYLALHGDLEFFNLYEAESLATLTGPDYQARLDDPTPWTLATVRHFRSTTRALCRVAASFGEGQGGLAATWRYDVAPAEAEAHRAALSDKLLPLLAEEGIVAGAHLLIADPEASARDSAERRARGQPNLVPRWIVVVEGWGDEADFDVLCRETLSDRRLISLGATNPAAAGLYRLQATRGRGT